MEWQEKMEKRKQNRMQDSTSRSMERVTTTRFFVLSKNVARSATRAKIVSHILKPTIWRRRFRFVKGAGSLLFQQIQQESTGKRKNTGGPLFTTHLRGGLSVDRVFESTDEEYLRLVAHPQIVAVASCSLGGAVNVGDSVLARRIFDRNKGLVVAVRLTPADNVGVEEGITSPSALYTGVYNVHGGPQASRFIINQLFPHLGKLDTEQGGISAYVIKRAFESTEQEFLRLVKGSWIANSQIASVGSCCLVGAISGDLLYVANLGDYRSLLGRRLSDRNKGPVVAQRLTTDHNVAVEEVRKEIEALHRGVWRIKDIIQVSRSIGDVYLKKPEFHRDPLFQQFGAPVLLKLAVMTGEPTIQIIKL